MSVSADEDAAHGDVDHGGNGPARLTLCWPNNNAGTTRPPERTAASTVNHSRDALQMRDQTCLTSGYMCSVTFAAARGVMSGSATLTWIKVAEKQKENVH
jgi:hypothetical protein